MAILFGKIGWTHYSVVIVGGMLAASTGIVGATVVTMGLISLPTMLKRGYDKIATGVIASSGTLGQIIPPSVVLVLLGSVLNISVGDLFTSALLPGITLIFLYVIYIAAVSSFIRPDMVPAMPENEIKNFRKNTTNTELIKTFILPFVLIFSVLGSIFLGIASPTEAAGIGALGAIVLSYLEGGLNFKKIDLISLDTMKLTSIVFMILLGATSFSLIFRGIRGR